MLEKFLTSKKLIELLRKKITAMSAVEAMKFLFEVDHGLYELEGQTAVKLGDGVHTKHRHINYHKFFTDNLEPNQRVLDIGCSSGELTVDLAKKVAPGKVVGIELVEEKVKIAKEKYQLPNLTFIFGDALKDLPNEKFDVITLSNVLEHIDKRVEFLKKVKEKYQPKYFLIRVPMFERDWRIPLQKELELDYRLDNTHCIEYRYEELMRELKSAGLSVESMKINWGEYWLKAK
jgi:2-polyprenyl-3-methyl-5-hydroxy-6-metoxy-1,4-benzoquinol methylase